MWEREDAAPEVTGPNNGLVAWIAASVTPFFMDAASVT